MHLSPNLGSDSWVKEEKKKSQLALKVLHLTVDESVH